MISKTTINEICETCLPELEDIITSAIYIEKHVTDPIIEDKASSIEFKGKLLKSYLKLRRKRNSGKKE